ncbi:MAG: uroporphyrinogen decarboxylase [Gammaproteobacteria bacterium]|nr:uroporphyrinogen decarboxylase [Gammaproteobacteria bacterium]
MPIFLDACAGASTPNTPIWLNRQAGRYMPEYHILKGDTPSLEFFKNPELAAKATLDAQRILGVDAAIMFADLLPVLEPMGLNLEYKPGVGPVFENPLRDKQAIEALAVVPAEEGCGYVVETLGRILNDLPKEVALIGFAGAPFTLACYAVEGKSSRNYAHVKRLMYDHEVLWQSLMDKLVDTVADYVQLQIASGAQAIQLFDSWVGCLSLADYERYVAPATRRLMERIQGELPIIYFGTGNAHLLDAMYATGPDLMALDWRVPLVATWDRLGSRAIQGNLDPIALCGEPSSMINQAQTLIDEVGGRPGHIFNLGHGIIPETPVDNVKRLVDFVREQTAR